MRVWPWLDPDRTSCRPECSARSATTGRSGPSTSRIAWPTRSSAFQRPGAHRGESLAEEDEVDDLHRSGGPPGDSLCSDLAFRYLDPGPWGATWHGRRWKSTGLDKKHERSYYCCHEQGRTNPDSHSRCRAP